MRSRLIFMFVVGFGTAAWGQGVGGNSPTETSYTLTLPYQIDPATQWDAQVGSTQARIGVELDTAGPTWLKHFSTGVPATSTIPEHDIHLYEHLVISGGLSWSGWTMQIDDPDFAWVLGFPFPATRFRANGAVPSGLNITADGGTLRFSFDPLPPGTQIDITAGLRYTGGYVLDQFDIHQFPTPEPSTFLGFILLTCLTRRR